MKQIEQELKSETVAAVTKYADKTRCFDKMMMIVSDIKMNSELFLCASDLNMCRKMNITNMKTKKKSKIIFFQSLCS